MSHFRSAQNRASLLKKIHETVQQNYGVDIKREIDRNLDDVIVDIYMKCGRKPPDISEEIHLKSLNNQCVDSMMKHIIKGIEQFRSTQPPPATASTALVSVPAMAGTNVASVYNSRISKANVHREKDHKIQQPMNFQTPTDNPRAGEFDKNYASYLDQRSRDFPGMKTPTYKNPNEPTTEGVDTLQGGDLLMNILMKTQVVTQNPSLLPQIMHEINHMPNMVDTLNRDPIGFQRVLSDPKFLQMIITSIKNKSDPNMKTLMNETQPPLPPQLTSQLTPQLTPQLPPQLQPQLPTTGIPADINQFNVQIPPSEQLVKNTLPDLDQVYLIHYDLSLDFRTDLTKSDISHQYPLQFVKFGNISKVELMSCHIPENDLLVNEPFIYMKIEELGGRCYTANHDVTFAKLVLSGNDNGYLLYKPDYGSGVQTFSQPNTFQKFTVSFLDYQGRHLDLKEINVEKATKLTKLKQIKFHTIHKHKLVKDDCVDVHVYQNNDIDSYTVKVEDIVDDKTFVVNNEFESLSDHMVVLRHSVNCHFTFRMYEINWHLLTKKSLQNAQLIRLSQLVTERHLEALKTIDNDQEIVRYVKQHLNLI
jgi:hypothetical protein